MARDVRRQLDGQLARTEAEQRADCVGTAEAQLGRRRIDDRGAALVVLEGMEAKFDCLPFG